MILRGIEFGDVFVASGTLNFFGEGWEYHRYCKMFSGFDFSGVTFVSKTTTLNRRKGNLHLNQNLQSDILFPDCVRVYPLKGVILNAVGLSGPGAKYLLEKGLWQKRTEPFFISFMATGDTKVERVAEAKEFAKLLKKEIPNFSSKFGLELNISCPNTKQETQKLVADASEQLKVLSELDSPLILKINALTPIEAISEIVNSNLCDAITVSNTIPWGQLSDEIDWLGIFGSMESPLKHFGGGGLSGYPLLPIVANWVIEARNKGIDIPIIAGGGILKKDDVNLMFQCGADAIFIGSVAILRPWRVKSIIKRAKELGGV